VYNADLRKHYDLKDPAWRYDIMPETVDGHNVADFIDPDIDAKLAELEREEDELEAQHQAEVGVWSVGLSLGWGGHPMGGAQVAGSWRQTCVIKCVDGRPVYSLNVHVVADVIVPDV
jgi:hypothetical protein